MYILLKKLKVPFGCNFLRIPSVDELKKKVIYANFLIYYCKTRKDTWIGGNPNTVLCQPIPEGDKAYKDGK